VDNNNVNEYHIQDQKHHINTELIGIIKYRQAKKWLISIAVVALFSVILALMIYFMSSGVDVMTGWKEILLLMLGGFVGSFAKVIDFWFNNAEDDVKLLEHADD
tara:strand:+ start:743 stop:1054 length:312 start_codon:yes stop_codon:yes gene_type:complete